MTNDIAKETTLNELIALLECVYGDSIATVDGLEEFNRDELGTYGAVLWDVLNQLQEQNELIERAALELATIKKLCERATDSAASNYTRLTGKKI